MQLGYESLRGIDRDRLLSVVEPVLSAHGVDAVELIWRSDSRGWVLYLTVERPGSTDPGAGITLDLCADISRDLSAALDVADVLPGRYRLDVGSPGVERALYSPRDYARFAGQKAKLKLEAPLEGQRVVRGTLGGVDEEGRIVFVIDGREHRFPPDHIESGRLSFDWQAARGASEPAGKGGRKRPRAGRAAERDR
jgi:ribosome maturation factor RimP